MMTTKEIRLHLVEEKSVKFAILAKTKMKSYSAMDVIEDTICIALTLLSTVSLAQSGIA